MFLYIDYITFYIKIASMYTVINLHNLTLWIKFVNDKYQSLKESFAPNVGKMDLCYLYAYGIAEKEEKETKTENKKVATGKQTKKSENSKTEKTAKSEKTEEVKSEKQTKKSLKEKQEPKQKAEKERCP